MLFIINYLLAVNDKKTLGFVVVVNHYLVTEENTILCTILWLRYLFFHYLDYQKPSRAKMRQFVSLVKRAVIARLLTGSKAWRTNNTTESSMDIVVGGWRYLCGRFLPVHTKSVEYLSHWHTTHFRQYNIYIRVADEPSYAKQSFRLVARLLTHFVHWSEALLNTARRTQ